MRKLPSTLSEQEVLSLVKASKLGKHKLAILLGFYQCLRVSEVCKLLPQDIDQTRGFIHVKMAKGKKDRDIPLMPELARYLKYLPLQRTPRSLQIMIKNLAKKTLNRIDVHFHTLRHSGATYYLNDKGLDIRFIQIFLGHSQLSTTQIYTHVNPSQLKNKFEEVWK